MSKPLLCSSDVEVFVRGCHERNDWMEGRRTEQRALMSKARADGLDEEAILQVPSA